MSKRAIVIKTHKSAYPNPIRLIENEIVTISHCDLEWQGWIWIYQASGHAGWAPQQIFSFFGPDKGICIEDYTAHELSVNAGETVLLGKKLNGWYWAKSQSGESGWLPHEHVNVINP